MQRMTESSESVPTVERERLREVAESLRGAADDLDRLDAAAAGDCTEWTLGALRILGDVEQVLDPARGGLLFFGREYGRLTQTTMAAHIGLTSSTLSRRLAVARSKMNMAEWWAEHQK